MSAEGARRLMVGIRGAELSDEERRLFGRLPPYGFILFARNLVEPRQAADLVAELRALADPSPLLYVDQEGGTVDRIGPLFGPRFPSAEKCAAAGSDRVHECAYLMGRAARLLGFDVDLAPVLDLAQPKTGKVILAGRCFGFHTEDVVLSGLVFLHGLARAGIASCLKHYPGLGRGAVDSHLSLPVVDAHDVDLLVTDVLPFTRLAEEADGILVGHASYPRLLGDDTPASLSRETYRLLREHTRFRGVVYSDDLAMGALEGTLAERAGRAAAVGCDVMCVSTPGADHEGIAAAVAEAEEEAADTNRAARLDALREKCASAPRASFSEALWRDLADENARFLEEIDRPRKIEPEPVEADASENGE